MPLALVGKVTYPQARCGSLGGLLIYENFNNLFEWLSQGKLALPADERKFIGVSGNTAAWFSDRIAIIFGGSEPEAPNGGRRMLLFTNQTDVPENICAAGENCKILENLQQSHSRTIDCDVCKAEYHWCCSTVSHLRRLPQRYSCPNCVAKTRKRK